MQAAVLYGPRDVRVEERPTPRILDPTDAVISLSATCICGSDLWPYRGLNPIAEPTPMGHEYCGIVEEVGRSVTSIKKGQFVIGSFAASDNTCPHCRAGYQTSCVHRQWMLGAQAPWLRVPLADGTLVATPDLPSSDMVPSLLTASDVLGVLSAKQMGAARIIAMSRHGGSGHAGGRRSSRHQARRSHGRHAGSSLRRDSDDGRGAPRHL
jgi:threonine dehydrogenase-like Zn-dependent dehydrogenase